MVASSPKKSKKAKTASNDVKEVEIKSHIEIHQEEARIEIKDREQMMKHILSKYIETCSG